MPIPRTDDQMPNADSNAVIGAPEEPPLRILLVDDHAMLREALKALLESDPTLKVVGESATVAGALEAVDKLKPAVAIVDVGLPDRTGIDLATELKARKSSTRVLMLTAHAHREYVMAALGAGALGYVLKDASHVELLKGIRAVASGQIFLCVHERLKAEILVRVAQGTIGVDWRSFVTRREREVLTAVAQGLNNKTIARSLDLSIKTIEKHRGNVMRKLGMHNVAALTRFAIHEGLVDESGSPDRVPRGFVFPDEIRR